MELSSGLGKGLSVLAYGDCSPPHTAEAMGAISFLVYNTLALLQVFVVAPKIC